MTQEPELINFKNMKIQEKFDALIAEHGVDAVFTAIKGHSIKPDGGNNCTTLGCPVHYICNTTTGNCVLDLGKLKR